jgi:hypothetical protein
MSVSIDEALDMFDKQTPEQRERFVVDNDQKAGWAMRKMRSVTLAKQRNIEIANEEIERINKWLTHVNKSLDAEEGFFENLLINYGRMQRELEDRKTVVLPHGKISSRQGSAKWEVDQDKFVNWAQENGRDDLLRFKVEANLSAIKASLFGDPELGNMAVTSDGVIAEGIVIEPTQTTYKVEVEV